MVRCGLPCCPTTSKGDSSKLWRTLKGVLGDAPPADTDVHTADDFATFFNDKVDAVRASTAATPLYDVPHVDHASRRP